MKFNIQRSMLNVRSSKRCRPRRAVSRILSASRRSVWLCVHLSTPPKRSSRRSEMRHTRNHRRATRFPILPCTRMGLSSLHCYLWSGELLPPLFTLTSGKPEAVIFCDTIRHARLPSRAPAFTGIPALRCPDFPLIPEGTSERPHAEVDASYSAEPNRNSKREFHPSFCAFIENVGACLNARKKGSEKKGSKYQDKLKRRRAFRRERKR